MNHKTTNEFRYSGTVTKPGFPLLVAGSLLLLTACANGQSAADRILPYWDAPRSSSPTVLKAAQEFDLESKPYPNLASVPPRPKVSATERIASLEPELSGDLDLATELRGSDGRPDLPPPGDGDGLEAYKVDPAPEPPTLVTAPRVDFTAPAVRIPTKPVPQDAGAEEGLPERTNAVPTPPPLLDAEEPSTELAVGEIIEAPPEPVIEELAVPEPITTAPPAFVVDPIEPPPPAFETPPELAEAPSFEPLPDIAEPPPAFEVASAVDPIETGKPVEPTLAGLAITDSGDLSDDARARLDELVLNARRDSTLRRFRIVGYGDADTVTADTALTNARLVADYLQQNGIDRGRLILAPPDISGEGARTGSVAVFALP